MIGQFCGPYFTVRPAKFESFLSRAASLINLRDIINILLTSFVFSVRTASYGSSFFFFFFPVDEKTRSVTYSTDRENEVSKRYVHPEHRVCDLSKQPILLHVAQT